MPFAKIKWNKVFENGPNLWKRAFKKCERTWSA